MVCQGLRLHGGWGISRTTVIRAITLKGSPKYDRTPGSTSITPFRASGASAAVEHLGHAGHSGG